MNLILMIAIAVLILIFLGMFIYSKNKYPKHPQNYRALFIIGISYIPIGIALKNYAFAIIGVVLMIIGLYNKKSWGDGPTWNDYTPEQKKIKITVIIFMLLLFAAGIVTYFIVR